MSPVASHLLHQALFGGIAAAGFGVLFNCPPRFLWLGFASGALALAVRTGGQEIAGLGLPAASFIAAFFLAFGTTGFAARFGACCCWLHPDDSRQPRGERLDEPLRATEGDSWRGASVSQCRHREFDARSVHPRRNWHSAGNSTPCVPGRAKRGMRGAFADCSF
jgi:hypothetical protein